MPMMVRHRNGDWINTLELPLSKSGLTELEARDASCPKDKKMEHKTNLINCIFLNKRLVELNECRNDNGIRNTVQISLDRFV